MSANNDPEKAAAAAADEVAPTDQVPPANNGDGGPQQQDASTTNDTTTTNTGQPPQPQGVQPSSDKENFPRESTETAVGDAPGKSTDAEKQGMKATGSSAQPEKFPPLKEIPVEQLYDHDHFDLSKMEATQLFCLLE